MKYTKIQIALFGGGILVLFVIVSFLISSAQIGYSVREQCERAKLKYEGNCKTALLKTFQDETSSDREKRSAIWAIGMLGDASVLPEVRALQAESGSEFDYSFGKAIGLLEGGLNLPALIWRDESFAEM